MLDILLAVLLLAVAFFAGFMVGALGTLAKIRDEYPETFLDILEKKK